MIVSAWQNSYDLQWGKMLTPESFSHPAKVSPGLAKRIFEHCLEKGYIKKNEVCVDPFSGICGFGIWAASFGIRFIGVELEEKFVKLAEANIALHKRAWKKLGKPIPQVLRGDSRRLSAVLSGADLICTSPPFADCLHQTEGGMLAPHQRADHGRNEKAASVLAREYGQTPGQLGAMKAGDISAVVCSPPYAESLKEGKSGIDWEKSQTPGAGRHLRTDQLAGGYSTNPQNLGNLPAGKVENVVSGIVTSPPFADSLNSAKDGGGCLDPLIAKEKYQGTGMANWKHAQSDYGTTPGQIGQQSGSTYWEAVRDVYAECYKVLKPGGVMVVVVKSYIKAGRRVPLPMQTLKLLIHLGFEPLERIKAMLVKEEVSAGLFGEIRKVKERKSFFRRNHEFKQAAKEYWPTIPRDEQAKYLWNNRHKSKKRTRVIEIAQCAALNSYRKEGNTIGHLAKKNRIDFEEVLIAQKPLDKAESSVIL